MGASFDGDFSINYSSQDIAESINEGTKAFLAYRKMKEGIEDLIKGIRILRGHIDNAPYNKKFSLMTSELYKFQIDMEKKLYKFIPQISKLSKDKMLESVNEGFSPSLVKKAIDIAKKMSDNMTGAVKGIEKIKKGLSSDPKVKAALRKANESVKEDIGIDTYLGGIIKAMRNADLKPKTAKQMKSGFSVSKDKIGFFIDVEQRGFDKIEKYTLQIEVDKKGDLWYLSGNRPLHMGPWANTNRVTRMFRMLNKIRGFGQTKFGKI